MITPIKVAAYSTFGNVSTFSVSQQIDQLTCGWNLSLIGDAAITNNTRVSLGVTYNAAGAGVLVSDGIINSWSKSLSQSGYEVVVSGRGPLAKLIDNAPEKDLIYYSEWDTPLDLTGDWEQSGCGIRRNSGVPPGIDPTQDVATYIYNTGKYWMRNLMGVFAQVLTDAGYPISIRTNLPNYKFRGVWKISRSQTYLSALKQLISNWDPYVYMYNGTLYIIDKDSIPPTSLNMTFGPASCNILAHQNSYNDIINRVQIEGGPPDTLPDILPVLTWKPRVDTISGVMPSGEDLIVWCTEVTTNEVTASVGTSTIRTAGYFKPLFGDPLLVYNKTTVKIQNVPVQIEVELFKYKFQPSGNTCMAGYGRRRQIWASKAMTGYGTSVQYGWTGTRPGEDSLKFTSSAADMNSTIGSLMGGVGGSGWLKILDEDEFSELSTGVSDPSVTFGVKFGIVSTSRSGTASPATVTHQELSDYESVKTAKANNYQMQWKVTNMNEVYFKNTGMAVERHDVSYDLVRAKNMSEAVVQSGVTVNPQRTTISSSNNKDKDKANYHKYFEDGGSIADHGRKPLVTIYDPSITNDGLAGILAQKIFRKSAKINDEAKVALIIGNTLVAMGALVGLEAATYNKIDVTTGELSQITLAGGQYMVVGYNHSFDNGGFHTEVQLRKV